MFGYGFSCWFGFGYSVNYGFEFWYGFGYMYGLWYYLDMNLNIEFELEYRV